MARVFELDVPSVEKLVLLAMADHARDDGTGCYPSMGGLARKTSQSRRGVQLIVRRLERKGLLTATFISNGGRGKATEYRISLENMGQKALNFRGESPPDSSRSSEGGSANGVRSSSANGVRSTRGTECEQEGPLLRTGFAGSANDSARNCERGSHESLGTIIEPSRNEDEEDVVIVVAFSALGYQVPFGDSVFRRTWAEQYGRISASSNGSGFTDAMQATIDKCRELNCKIPGVFFGLKTNAEKWEIEKRFRKATPL